MSRDIIVGGDPKALTAYQQSYHWRNKNCTTWAHEWLKTNVPGVSVDDAAGKGSAGIKEVTSVSGDCDLGQRKGKLLTIYDFEVEMRWEGTDAEGNDVNGTVKVPEMSHEAIDGLADYQFNISLSSSSSAPASTLLAHLRAALPPLLTDKFNSFRPALLAAHGAPSSSGEISPSPSGTSTPAAAGYAPAPPGADKKPATAPKEEAAEKKKAGGVGRTAVVEVEAQMHASAEDLWGVLTEEAKIPMWSRSQAKMELKPGGAFELFGGNVRGKVESIEKPSKLVMSWQPRMPSWPSEHYGTMTLTLKQGSDSTALTFHLEGVPVGQEKETEEALNSFYIRGLKSMGSVLSVTSRSFNPPPPPSSSRSPRRGPPSKRKPPSTSSLLPSSQTLAAGAIFGLAAVFVGLVVSSFSDARS